MIKTREVALGYPKLDAELLMTELKNGCSLAAILDPYIPKSADGSNVYSICFCFSFASFKKLVFTNTTFAFDV